MSLFLRRAIMAGVGGQIWPQNHIAFPLTYNEVDLSETLTLQRQGQAPWITPEGMRGDGYMSRYKLEPSDVPPWLGGGASSPLTLQLSAKAFRNRSSSDTIVSVCENDISANPKLALKVIEDPEYPETSSMVIEGYTSILQRERLNRVDWNFFMRWPDLERDGFLARTQGLEFIDENTVLISAHYEDQFSMCYKVDVTTGTVLGSFRVNPILSSGSHIGSISKRPSDGKYWFSENADKVLYEVDLDASFSSGTMVITATYDATVTASTSSIAFVEIDGTEYLLIGEYLESGSPKLHVIPSSDVVDGGVYDFSERVKYFVIQQRCQGVYRHTNGKLYITSNRFDTDGSPAPGRVYSVDFDTALDALADGSVLGIQYDWPAPSQYPEDLSFRPGTNELWTQTEGLTSVGSHKGFISVWHRTVTEEKYADLAENHYTFEYDGGSSVVVKINNQVFDEFNWGLTVSPETITFGGNPVETEGQSSGFFVGTVKDVIVQDKPLNESQYDSITSGSYYDKSLDVYPVSLVNPDAETGDTSGWTTELGDFSVEDAITREPFGTYFFFAGAAETTIARQRVDILSQTGLTLTELNDSISSGRIWVRINWQQSSFTSGQDNGGMGVRLLDGFSSQIVESLSEPLVTEPRMPNWIPRSWVIELPSGSREIDAVYLSNRLDGTNNDTYVDEIEMVLYKTQP